MVEAMVSLKALANFWGKCIYRAFFGSYAALSGFAGPIISLIVALLQKFRPEPNISGLIASDYAISIPLLATLIFFVIRLVNAPFQLYRTELNRANALEEKLRPKLEISLRDPTGTDQCTWVSNETEGGFRNHHPQLAFSKALCIIVKNTSTMRTGRCVGLLTEVQRLEDGDWRSIGPAEPVELPWHTTSPEEHLSKVIEPMTAAQLWIASINYNGFTWLIRDLTKLHGNQQSIFGSAGTYRARIQISDGISDPSIVEVELTSEPDQHTHYMRPGLVQSKLARPHLPQA